MVTTADTVDVRSSPDEKAGRVVAVLDTGTQVEIELLDGCRERGHRCSESAGRTPDVRHPVHPEEPVHRVRHVGSDACLLCHAAPSLIAS